MNNGGIARLKYYRGQTLTARDFEDQQEYHREKQKLLLQRFPSGIIGGLVVTCAKKGDTDPADFDGFLIGAGLAVDPEGNELVVPEGGLKVPVSDFDPDNRYLSLVYDQGEDFVGGDLCGGSQKNNRITESVKEVWDQLPNLESHITVAFIRLKEGKKAGVTCDDFRDPMDPALDPADPPVVRKNARVVDTEQITDSAVTNKKIGNGAITDAKLAPNAVITDKILNSAVTDTKLATNAVSRDKIQDDAVNTDKLADGAVVGDKIPDKSIITEKLALDVIITDRIKDENVTDAKLATDAVIEVKIKNGNVTQHKLAIDAVTETKIKDGSVTNTKLAPDAVTTLKIKDENVIDTKLAPNAVTEVKIRDGNVTNIKLATDAVTDTKIKDESVTESKLATDAVITGKIKDGAVTKNKLAADALTATQIADEVVTDTKLATDAVIAVKIKNENVTEQKLAIDAVTETKIKDGAVTSAKLNLITTRLSQSILGEQIDPSLRPSLTDLSPIAASPNSIIHIVPTSGELSWTFSVQGGGPDGKLIYKIRVFNPGSVPVTFDVKEIQFN